ncbi:MAG: elongation factor P [Myxococcota bacterium]
MYSTSDFRRGLRILHEGKPYELTEVEHHKPGKGAAVVRTKLKNLLTGLTTDYTFRSGDKVEKADLVEHQVQYLYHEGDVYHFMDPNSYEQYAASKEAMGQAVHFLTENVTVTLVLYQGRAIAVELPPHAVLEVIECDPAVRGDTVSGATKEAVLATGTKCQVPLFINQGEKVRVDTRTGRYIERA